MHATFMQSSFKFNMLHCTKLQLVRLYSTKQSAKSKNHYDTLNITPHANQNEVKSAYYKLTLQYHPDKNKSEYARQKFQDISDAYEVLSNYDQRKIYDRSLMLRQRPTVSTTTEQSRSHYKDKVYSGSSKIYNFEAWTEAHYGKQMQEGRMRKQVYEHLRKMEKDSNTSKNSPQYMEIALFLLTVSMIAMFFRGNTDVPISKKHKKEINNDGN